MVLLTGSVLSICFPFFLSIASSFALLIIGIYDTATVVIPGFYAITDMVTYIRLALQDLITPNIPELSSDHLSSLAVPCVTLP